VSGGPDVSNLTPQDAVVALRSFPRRFAAALALDEDEDESVLTPAIEETDRAGRDLAVLAAAVDATLVHDEPVLHPAVTDESARTYPDVGEVDAERALDLLRLEAEALAERVGHVPPDAWSRKAKVAGGGERVAIDVLREAVRATATHLREAERARGRR
jgi:hypothetical protein